MIAAPADGAPALAPARFIDGQIIPDGYLAAVADVIDQQCEIEELLTELGIEDWT